MPWEKQFERDDALEKAMKAFWEKGYEGTSMKDLIGRMGLNPGSIYATFGDKKTLFCEALQYYQGQTRELFKTYEDTHTPRAAILAVFNDLVEDVRTGCDTQTCFLVNSIVEAAPKDPQIDQLAQAGVAEFEDFLQRMIKAGQETNEISPSVEVEKTARLLLGLITGGRVLGRVHFDANQMADFKDLAASLLD